MLSDMAVALVSALLGGGLALTGGWLAIRWQTRQNARALAFSVLAELATALEIDPAGNADRFYRHVLEAVKSTGEVVHAKALVGSLDQDPFHVAPVYYGSVANIGLLPPDLGKAVMVVYSRMQGLRVSAIRGLGGQFDFEPDQLKAVAYAIEQQYDLMLAERASLISALRSYLKLPPAP
jgi:hypothetical protein